MRTILFLSLPLLLLSCASDVADTQPDQQTSQRGLQLTTSVNDFAEDDARYTRTNMAGNSFAAGDRMKLKIICPYTEHTNFGETTYSNTADGFWLLKWDGSTWAQVVEADSVDMAAEYKYSDSYNLFSHFEAQQTPYVFTASTWNENVLFIAPDMHGQAARSLFSQYSYIFHANQQLEQDFLACDLLWAQTYMQTGAYNVHLAFNHVMACLEIDITALGLTTHAVVTVNNLPDIDQHEVVVGDYYAARAKNLTHTAGANYDYSYRRKCSCDMQNNGKVLGVAVITDSTATADIHTITGNPVNSSNSSPVYVENNATYTAHRNATNGKYYLIIPPCSLTNPPTIWIRDGEKRYTYTLSNTLFAQGKRYPITLQAPVSPTPPDNDND